MATKDDVLSALNKKDVVLLDVRDKEEWIGTSSSPYGTRPPSAAPLLDVHSN
jgi:thiosulfate/3-mercaptopyruvate sulfurtransferase